MSNLPLTEHRLTWRMWHPVYVFAHSREAAIAEAIRTQPNHIPAGTELYYGPVAGSPVAIAKETPPSANAADNPPCIYQH